jgi:hypothetical protein
MQLLGTRKEFLLQRRLEVRRIHGKVSNGLKYLTQRKQRWNVSRRSEKSACGRTASLAPCTALAACEKTIEE